MQEPKTLVYLYHRQIKKWFPKLHSDKYLVVTPGQPLLGYMIDNRILCFGTVPLREEWEHFTIKLSKDSYAKPIELVVFSLDQKETFTKYLEENDKN